MQFSISLCLALGIVALGIATTSQAETPWTYPIKKWGSLGVPLVEVTPLVFQGELYLLENWRSGWPCPQISRELGEKRNELWMARLPQGPEEYDQREYVGKVMTDHTLGSAIVWEDRVYVFATATTNFADGRQVDMSWSSDMKQWSKPVTVLTSNGKSGPFPRGHVFNTSATRDAQGLVFLWETNGLGRPFTMCLGRVEKPTDPWGAGIIEGAHYGMDKYTGGPALYKEGDWYYLLYLEALGGRTWETRITRSRDLVAWQDAAAGRLFLPFDPERTCLNPASQQVRERNASDAELCEYKDRTLIFFTGGDQSTTGDLQWATFDGKPRELLEAFFQP